MNDFQEIEQALFDRYGQRSTKEVPVVFLLAAPRCGSTLLYQLLVDALDVFYLSNFINDHFAEFPVVGAAIANAAMPSAPAADFRSAYGKTTGAFGPSEGSHIFRNWFGGEHPSQLRSARLLPGKQRHIRQTMRSLFAISGKATVTKNAWNCFRIQELLRVFPQCHFIWLKRDLRRSAISDLQARYARGGPTVWNSATTANVEELKRRPYWEQVVEQQYEFNRSLAADLSRYCPARHTTVWYEQVCDDPAAVLDRCHEDLTSGGMVVGRRNRTLPQLCPSTGPSLESHDEAKISRYIVENRGRFASLLWESGVGDGDGRTIDKHQL